jgi:hypothetical protein
MRVHRFRVNLPISSSSSSLVSSVDLRPLPESLSGKYSSSVRPADARAAADAPGSITIERKASFTSSLREPIEVSLGFSARPGDGFVDRGTAFLPDALDDDHPPAPVDPADGDAMHGQVAASLPGTLCCRGALAPITVTRLDLMKHHCCSPGSIA